MLRHDQCGHKPDATKRDGHRSHDRWNSTPHVYVLSYLIHIFTLLSCIEYWMGVTRYDYPVITYVVNEKRPFSCSANI
jgi:hypothetical protein